MLSYDEFRKEFKAQFPKAMGEGYEGYFVEDMPINKNGTSLDGFTFSNGKSNIKPTFYYNYLYARYEDGVSMAELIDSTVDAMVDALAKARTMMPSLDADKIKANVIYELVNPSRMGDYLDTLPHRSYLDLAIIYRWVVEKGAEGVASAVIDNKLMNTLDLTEEELFLCAVKNTPTIFHSTVKSLGSIVTSMLSGSDEFDVDSLSDNEEVNNTLVVSNEENFRGANSILDSNVLNSIADRLGGNFYVLPSSIHEVLAMRATDDIDADSLRDMVVSVNSDCVMENERLSNNVYIYNTEKGELSIA